MRLPSLRPGQVCLGAALVVPDPVADEFRRVRCEFGEPDSSPPHITVIPPTPVSKAQVEAVVDHMRAAAGRFGAIRVHLRGAGTFRPVSPVVYAAVTDGFERCRELESLVRGAVTELEDRFPYHPHVTVANGCDEATLDRAEHATRHIDSVFAVDELTVSLLGPSGEWRTCRRVRLGSLDQTPGASR
jgi:2'-5' RNA ligase